MFFNIAPFSVTADKADTALKLCSYIDRCNVGEHVGTPGLNLSGSERVTVEEKAQREDNQKGLHLALGFNMVKKKSTLYLA